MNIKQRIKEKIDNGYAETYVGYHPNYQVWNGYEQRGCYAQIAAPYGGTIRIYEHSYAELEVSVLEYFEFEISNLCLEESNESL